MSDLTDTPTPPRCPTCTAPAPSMHPAVQCEGEVQPCGDPWHGDPDPRWGDKPVALIRAAQSRFAEARR